MTKSILLKAVICLILLSSCTARRSFLHQRYTHYGHSKTQHVAQQPKERKSVKQQADKPSVNVLVTQQTMTAKEVSKDAVLTSNVAVSHKTGLNLKTNRASVLPGFMIKPIKDLASTIPLTGYSKAKQISQNNNKAEKRGLLFGVIDAILAIILAALFVALIVLLVLLLI